jgi:hypothetical protein
LSDGNNGEYTEAERQLRAVGKRESILYEEIKEYFEDLERNWGVCCPGMYGKASLKRATAERNTVKC